MHYEIRLIVALIAIISIGSCISPIVMDPHKADMPVVVNCVLMNDSIQTLKLFYATGKSHEKVIPVDSAIVTVSCEYNSVSYSYRFYPVGDGEWKAKFKPFENIEYKLKIELEDKTVLSASTTFPIDFTLNSNWYLNRFYENTTIEQGPEKKLTNTIRVPRIFYVMARRNEKSDKLCKYITTDFPYTDNFNATSVRLADIDYFNKDTMDYYFSHYPHSIDDRSLLSKKPGLVMHKKFLRLEYPAYYQDRDSSDHIFIFASFNPSVRIKFVMESLFCAYCVSDEYDKYLKYIYNKQMNLSEDITEIYNWDDYYTNIDGGKGIFGAACKEKGESPYK